MKKIGLGFLVCLLMAGFVYAKEDAKMKDAFDVIHARKSVRNFTGAPVSKMDLEKIIKAGMAAPTAANMQPWSFIVITERKTLDDLAAGLPTSGGYPFECHRHRYSYRTGKPKDKYKQEKIHWERW
jgi:nitroreductase